ncbi:MAG TPA: SDR family oxidoreductase [Acidimicrobiia bacterium]|jgi:NAD(P)-dependent dehydrogenase (short-subunit alcohol dehydrogenase family)
MELAGRHAVVTGGASGIGAALVRRFAAAGAKVTVGDIDGAGAAAVAAEVDGVAAEVDVADEAQNRALVAAGEARFGPVDVFCANAGIAIAGDPFTDDASWDRMWSVNVRSHLYAVRAVLPGMLERAGGYLVHTASAAGLLTQLGSAPYAVTKHAVVALAEWLAITYGPRGIRVSVLAPQAVRTAMTAGIESGDSPLAVAGVDGMLEPEEVADAVVAAMAYERFLILPHPQVAEYVRRKAEDPDRWIAGMQRLQARLDAAE